MWRRPIKLILFFALPVSALIFISVLYAPNYLNYADQPIKADAVVLFIGPDLEAREKEASKLLDAGYANYLIIPAYNRISMKMPQIPASLTLNNDSSKTKNAGPAGIYPHFYENTHIEVLEAKRIMDHSGFKKANFVSSPSHLRRVKLITDHVFQHQNSAPDAYQIKFVPAIVESSGAEALRGI
jgi:hypothetical protein